MNYDMMSMIMIGLGQPDRRQEDIIRWTLTRRNKSWNGNTPFP